MNNRLFLRTIPSALNWLASATTTTLLLKIFLLNQIAEPIPGLMQLGLVFEGLLASVLASYAFYLIVVHLKEMRDRAVIYPHVLKWTQAVVGECKSQLAEFSNRTGQHTDIQSATKQDIESMFQKIDPNTNAPLIFSVGKYANWIQYFDHHRTRSKRGIAKIMAQLIFLEAPLVAYLTKVDDCNHFSMIEKLAHQKISNADLGAFADTFFDYCVACRSLNSYLANHAHGLVSK
jgi:hypothetical protein